MVPAHFAEVITRNAVAEALTAIYGERWPWSATFELSLPDPHPPTYDPRRDLRATRRRYTTPGKVIAELKFAFWESMFTARHHGRIWSHQIHSIFPHTTTTDSKQLRAQIHQDLKQIRELRNRVAHHEPIITRDLNLDLGPMMNLVQIRSTAAHTWLATIEEASTTITKRPSPSHRDTRRH